jgi:hypothetical protein
MEMGPAPSRPRTRGYISRDDDCKSSKQTDSYRIWSREVGAKWRIWAAVDADGSTGALRADYSANEWAYALSVFWLDSAGLDVLDVLGRQQRAELRRSDARNALTGGAKGLIEVDRCPRLGKPGRSASQRTQGRGSGDPWGGQLARTVPGWPRPR